MPQLYYNEDDYDTIVHAALDAENSGSIDLAHKIDHIQKKMNQKLSNQKYGGNLSIGDMSSCLSCYRLVNINIVV